MLDDIFSFIDPVIELNEGDPTHLVIAGEIFFDFLEKNSMNKAVSLPEGTKTEVPLDIALSLLRPDELIKLKKYVASYLMRHGNSQIS